MDNQTLHLAKKHRDYWIGRAQELQSNPHQLADEILEFTEREVKNCSIPTIVRRGEQLTCVHEEHTMQGNGFTYVVCAKCGIDL